VRPGIQWTASSGHPRCRERATYVLGPGRCERPDGRWYSNSGPGCGARSRWVRGSLADRIRGEKKIFCCVTMRGRNIGAFNGLGRGLGALTALFFGLGMSGFDPVILTTFSLAASRLPAADLPQAFRVLTVALVPAPWLVLASASLAQADPRARSPRSGQTVVFLRKLMGAHGRCFLPRESSGRMLPHSPRALSKLEQDACLPVYRLVENKTERQTVSSTRREQETQALLTKRSSCREQDRETNGLFDAPGTRNPSAAHQTIESAAESEIGPSERRCPAARIR